MLKQLMTLAIAAALSSVAFAQTPTQTPTQTPNDKLIASLQGSWVFTSANGQDLAGSGQEIVVTITGEKYTQFINGAVVEAGTFKLDATKKPMHLDLLISQGDDAGRIQLGIVEVTGDLMRGNLSMVGDTARPTSLEPAGGFAFTAKKAARQL